MNFFFWLMRGFCICESIKIHLIMKQLFLVEFLDVVWGLSRNFTLELDMKLTMELFGPITAGWSEIRTFAQGSNRIFRSDSPIPCLPFTFLFYTPHKIEFLILHFNLNRKFLIIVTQFLKHFHRKKQYITFQKTCIS